MKQKSYTFERVDGSADHVQLQRKGSHFHLLSRIVCLLLAVIFWLLCSALQQLPSETDDAPRAEAVHTVSTVL